MKGKHERQDSSSRCLFDRPEHSSFHWAEMTSKVIAVPGNLPTSWQLRNHSCSLCSASSRPPNFIHSTVTCPTNLAVPSLLSTLPALLNASAHNLGRCFVIYLPNLLFYPPPRKTNRKVIRVMSPKLSLLPFAATFCAHVLCVLLCGGKIPLFQQRRMNNGLVKWHWEMCVFHSCTRPKSSLGLFPFNHVWCLGGALPVWLYSLLEHDSCQTTTVLQRKDESKIRIYNVNKLKCFFLMQFVFSYEH